MKIQGEGDSCNVDLRLPYYAKGHCHEQLSQLTVFAFRLLALLGDGAMREVKVQTPKRQFEASASSIIRCHAPVNFPMHRMHAKEFSKHKGGRVTFIALFAVFKAVRTTASHECGYNSQ